MRALGRGSISSILKVVLDVAYVLLCVALAGLALLAVAALLLSLNPGLLPHVTIEGELERWPVMVGGLAAAALYVVGVLIVVGALRRVFGTLTAGDPFHPDNVKRLRLTGVILACLELGRHVVWALSAWVPGVDRRDPEVSLTAWFSVVVVFVLAEVFREGARLRREAELTI